ncbi:MBL fold metallo-hydrolase [[Kitasatospora] papulosa]|uniref:MBL fold metallo-hydrolase n=1 Tax=Streptomyces TaxID=1883 RepID=UPI0004C892C6|nr:MULTISPECIES: MBL fold metallo-hydrolase [Streptomyces]MDF9868567.1 L-ascorbate metabolism protein UlaG (beta-lactamase superfamily) [Streptomyces pratensis]TPN04123.1 MBL fold metallo-hydrolase [Mesorhizobium sp. B2-3-3]MCY1654997.1 MBL fold metallo-hydrolase [Streptomyces sp. SL203]MCY1677677.1 MBL fold metallo-hydrolase [Streptomyces sp. SL294]MDX2622553.1 MBL fold metallo-hydrolase [Streptomyces sp. WI03-5b]
MSQSRRSVLQGVLGAGAAGLLVGGAAPLPAARPRAVAKSAELGLRWLGVAGWELSFAGRSVLFDPYLSRMPYADADGGLDPALPLRLDTDAVDHVAEKELAGVPELILVSHGHFDHLADVPHLLSRPAWSGRRVRTLCDTTSRHLLEAMGTPAHRMADVVAVNGGDHLQFDGYSVEVFRSLHSRQQDYTSFAPGTRDAVPARPRTLGDLVEGQTLAFQVSVEGGPSVLLTGTSNVAERELAGARPDVAVVGMSGYSAVHGYPDRLLTALGSPSLLLPCHHDDMVTPLGSSGISGTSSSDAVTALTKAVERQGWAGGTRVLAPRHLELLDVTDAAV